MSYAAKSTRTRARIYLRSTSEPLQRLNVKLALTARERERLNLEAKVRGLLPQGLGRVVIERIIQDGLFNAVLDD